MTREVFRISIVLILAGMGLAACQATPEPTIAPLIPTTVAAPVITPLPPTPPDAICPAGGTTDLHFPSPGAVYQYLEGEPAVGYFDTWIFPLLSSRKCWRGGTSQIEFASNVDGLAHFYRITSIESTTWFGDVEVLSAGCLSLNGRPGTYIPSAIVSMNSDGLEMLGVSLDGTGMYFLQSNPDGSGLLTTNFQPSGSCY